MSVTMYTVQGVGNNNNGGSTTSASPKASGTGAATIVGATVTLSVDAPDLSTVIVGDTIRLNARTNGKNVNNPSDIFEITAVDDTLKTVDVTPAPNSITSGVTWAIGGAFATAGRLMSVLDQLDLGYLKGTFDEALDMTGDFAAQGSTTAPIRFIGYGTTPGDGGLATFDSNNTKANGIILRNVNSYWSFENLRITRYTNQGFRTAFCATPNQFNRCEVDNCGGNGFTTSPFSRLINCYGHNNSGDNFQLGDKSICLNCVSKDGSANGFLFTGGGVILGCVSRGDADAGIRYDDDLNHAPFVCVGCVVDGNAKVTTVGIYLADNAGEGQGTIMNTIVIDCVTGIQAATNNKLWAAGINNLVNNCTTAHTNFEETEGFVFAAPAFIDQANFNYTPVSSGVQVGVGHDLNESTWIPTSGTPVSIGPLQPLLGGSPDYPSASDVRDGTLFDSGSQSGTLVLPSVNDVRDGVGFGAP